MLLILLLHLLLPVALAAVEKNGATCTVTPTSPTEVPRGGKAPDDVPQILSAFKQCGQDGSIEFTKGYYYMGSVMDTLNFSNVYISLRGTYTWSTDIQYWLRSSLSVTYSGRSTAWRLGGKNITMVGNDETLFDGNGQTWYDQNRNQGNQNGRPISLTIWRATDVFIDRIVWKQPQFWNTFIAYSQNVKMTNLQMNATSNSQWNTVNTDGTNTWNSKDVVIKNWTVTAGDDCISVKGNSTNIHVSDITCYESGAMCVGSIGSNSNQPDYVENVLFENVNLTHSSNAAWIKTYPGRGYVKNITFRNIRFNDVNQPIYITPCIYNGQNCDSSRLQISNVLWENIVGTSRYNIGAGIHCSSAAPCLNLTFKGIDIKQKNGGGAVKYLCSNISNQNSSGLQCTGSCPANWPQQLDGNR